MVLLLYILILLGVLILLFWQLSNVISILFGCLYVSSDKKSFEKVIELFAKKNAIFYELGSGNGNTLKTAVKFGLKAEGFEISPFYYLLSKLNTIKYKNIKINFCDIKKIDLKYADIIYCYLNPKLLNNLSEKFLNETKKETILISKGFPVVNLKIFKKLRIKNRLYYIYKF